MITRLSSFFLLLVVIFVAEPASAARLALVIGNDAYQRVTPLERAVGDAQAIGASLQRLGYDVTLSQDVEYKAMARDIAAFAARIQPGDSVVFQFSGHGISIGGRNFLLPVDIEAPTAGGQDELEALSFDASKIVGQLMARKPQLVFAILDACRDNPFAAHGRALAISRGLARMDADPGEFIIFSAGPGEEALDRLGDDDREKTSVFTRVLLKSLPIPGITLQKLAKATQGGVSQLAASIHHQQFPDYFDRTLDEPVLSPGSNAESPPPPICASALEGHWTNNDPAGRNLDHLVVSVDCKGGKVAYGIEVFGRCTPTPCPWGVRPAVLKDDETLAAHFDFGFAIKDISARRETGRLHVVTATKFTDKSGRQPRVISDDLIKTR